jgi:hypothetical protein
MEMKIAEKIRPIEKVDDLTPAQRITKLNAERAKIDAEMAEVVTAAKEAALLKAQEVIKELSDLGFHYLLCEESEKPTGSKKGEQTGPCPVCKFMTNPPHGGRTHKSQTEKRAFTDEELKARGLLRVQGV